MKTSLMHLKNKVVKGWKVKIIKKLSLNRNSKLSTPWWCSTLTRVIKTPWRTLFESVNASSYLISNTNTSKCFKFPFHFTLKWFSTLKTFTQKSIGNFFDFNPRTCTSTTKLRWIFSLQKVRVYHVHKEIIITRHHHK